jgi:hypothetical protein
MMEIRMMESKCIQCRAVLFHIWPDVVGGDIIEEFNAKCHLICPSAPGVMGAMVDIILGIGKLDGDFRAVFEQLLDHTNMASCLELMCCVWQAISGVVWQGGVSYLSPLAAKFWETLDFGLAAKKWPYRSDKNDRVHEDIVGYLVDATLAFFLALQDGVPAEIAHAAIARLSEVLQTRQPATRGVVLLGMAGIARLSPAIADQYFETLLEQLLGDIGSVFIESRRASLLGLCFLCELDPARIGDEHIAEVLGCAREILENQPLYAGKVVETAIAVWCTFGMRKEIELPDGLLDGGMPKDGLSLLFVAKFVCWAAPRNEKIAAKTAECAAKVFTAFEPHFRLMASEELALLAGAVADREIADLVQYNETDLIPLQSRLAELSA